MLHEKLSVTTTRFSPQQAHQQAYKHEGGSKSNFPCVNGQKYLNIWREETARVRQSKVGEK